MLGFRPDGVLIAWLLGAALAAGGDGSAPDELPFRRLRFVAHEALFFKGEVVIEATLRDVATSGGDLRDCPEKNCTAPTGRGLVHLDATTEASFQAPSQSLTWLDARTLDVLQTLDARKGRSWKLRRSTADGLHEWIRRPEDKRERKRGLEAWTRTKEAHVAWEVPDLGRLRRTGSHALLYQAAAWRLDREGSRASLLARSRGRLLRVELEARELETVDVDYLRRRAGREEEVRGPVEARRVVVSGEPVDPEDEDDGSLGLLGMRSDIVLYLEVGTGLPLELRGKAPKLGNVRVRLAEAMFPPGP